MQLKQVKWIIQYDELISACLLKVNTAWLVL